MRKFERIRVEKGQAYIRNTGIPVLDIVHQLNDGRTLHELLKMQPALDDEDVVEALVYTLDNLNSSIRGAVHDTRAPLASIESAGVVLTNANGLNNAQKGHIAQMMSTTAARLKSTWEVFADWVFIKYGLSPTKLESNSLTAILNNVKVVWTKARLEGSLEVSLPEELPPVADNGYLGRMFTALLHPFIPVNPRLNYADEIIVSRTDDKQLGIQIVRKFEVSSPTTFSIEKFIWDSMEVSLTNMILHSLGSELEVHSSDTSVTFEFTLPIWKENT